MAHSLQKLQEKGEDMNKYFVLTVASIWFSSALAISVSLYYTRDMRSLWFLLVPLFVNIKADKGVQEL